MKKGEDNVLNAKKVIVSKITTPSFDFKLCFVLSTNFITLIINRGHFSTYHIAASAVLTFTYTYEMVVYQCLTNVEIYTVV